jgi:O-methyltransferase
MMSAKFRFLLNPVESAVRRFFQIFGYEIVDVGRDYAPDESDIIAKVKPFTATSTERIIALMNAVKYLVKNKIDGDFVECGVWRGGSMMTAMLTLLNLGDASRHFYLFDTFEGMTPPTDKDMTRDGTSATALLDSSKKEEGPNCWCIANLEDVRNNVFSTGYPKDKIHFIKGRVEDTLPSLTPKNIALLRLDTDWYESTHHELVHLYPILCQRGVLIIDDYGHWQGARRAVNEYFEAQEFVPLLNKLDQTGRLVVKIA